MHLIETKDKNFTVTIEGVNIHSKYSPLREAEKFVEQNITHRSTIIVLGAGLGYIFKILDNKYPNLEIIDIPYNKTLAKYSLDLNPSNRTQWDGIQNIDDFLISVIHEKNIKGLQIIEWDPVEKIFKQEAQIINNAIINRIRRVNGNLLTTARFGKKWLRNTLKNYINIETYITELKINNPIIIVASGKSLKYSIDVIKNIRDKVTLISLSSANMALDYYNIKSDITFSTDPGYYSKLHLSDMNGILAMPLTNSTSANNSVLLINQGNEFEEQLIHNLPKINLEENGTVAGTALLFALRITSKPIYLIGQDLQSNDVESHVRPYAFDTLLESKTNRTNPYYSVKYKRLINEGVTYKTYRDWFSKISKENPNRIFRLDSYSTKIDGIEDIKAETIIKLFRDRPKSYFSYTKKHNKTKKIREKEVIKIIKNWLESIEREEIEENSLFYLISTSQYTDANNKALSKAELDSHNLHCRNESIQFIERLLELYGKQLF